MNFDFINKSFQREKSIFFSEEKFLSCSSYSSFNFQYSLNTIWQLNVALKFSKQFR